MLHCFFTPTKNSLEVLHKILFLFNAIKLLNLSYIRKKINAMFSMNFAKISMARFTKSVCLPDGDRCFMKSENLQSIHVGRDSSGNHEISVNIAN
jgi:hypothetical protein